MYISHNRCCINDHVIINDYQWSKWSLLLSFCLFWNWQFLEFVWYFTSDIHLFIVIFLHTFKITFTNDYISEIVLLSNCISRVSSRAARQELYRISTLDVWGCTSFLGLRWQRKQCPEGESVLPRCSLHARWRRPSTIPKSTHQQQGNISEQKIGIFGQMTASWILIWFL